MTGSRSETHLEFFKIVLNRCFSAIQTDSRPRTYIFCINTLSTILSDVPKLSSPGSENRKVGTSCRRCCFYNASESTRSIDANGSSGYTVVNALATFINVVAMFSVSTVSRVARAIKTSNIVFAICIRRAIVDSCLAFINVVAHVSIASESSTCPAED